MDTFPRLIILLLSLFFSLPAYTAGNAWVPKWVDGPATTSYERTSAYLRTYVNVPSAGGHAQWTLATQPVSSNGGRYFAGASTATAAKIATSVKIPMSSAAGSAAVATLTAVIPKLNLAKAATALVRANPYVATALTLGWLANAGYEYLSSNDTFVESPPSTLNPASLYTALNGTQHATWSAAAVSTGAQLSAQNNCTPATNAAYCPDRDTPVLLSESSNSFSYSFPNTIYTNNTGAKVASTNCPTGYTYSGGTCNVNPGTPGVAVTQDEVNTALSNTPISGNSDTSTSFDGVLNDTIKNGFNPDTDGLTPSLTGSTAPVQGPASITTSPSGDVINNSTTYNNTYNNNYVDTSETKTSTTTPQSGPVSTTTTTGPANVETPQQTEQPTDCDKYPESIGCSKYGEVPAAEEIQTIDVSMTLSPTSLGSGSCPSPQVIDLHGQPDITLSYQRYCDFATQVSPIVIAFAWVSAGLIVLGAIREA